MVEFKADIARTASREYATFLEKSSLFFEVISKIKTTQSETKSAIAQFKIIRNEIVWCFLVITEKYIWQNSRSESRFLWIWHEKTFRAPNQTPWTFKWSALNDTWSLGLMESNEKYQVFVPLVRVQLTDWHRFFPSQGNRSFCDVFSWQNHKVFYP